MEAGTMEETELERKRRQQAEAAGETGSEQGAEVEPEPEATAEPDASNIAEHEGDPEGDGDGEQAVPPIVLEGEGQLSLSVGGNKPDSAEVKLRGGSIPVPAGQMKKGEVLNLMVKVQIAEVHHVDKIDNSTGEITATVRRHIAKIKAVEKIPAG